MTPVTLTLNDALKRALTANPALGRTRAQIAIAEAETRVAISSVLPKISLAGALTRNSLEAGFGSGKDRTIILARNDWNYRVNLGRSRSTPATASGARSSRPGSPSPPPRRGAGVPRRTS